MLYRHQCTLTLKYKENHFCCKLVLTLACVKGWLQTQSSLAHQSPGLVFTQNVPWVVPPVKAVCQTAPALLLMSCIYRRLLMYSELSLDMAAAEWVEEQPQANV